MLQFLYKAKTGETGSIFSVTPTAVVCYRNATGGEQNQSHNNNHIAASQQMH